MENIKKLNISKSLLLDCKQTVKDFPLAYETYGKLNENKDNAILVFHALTGDQFVTGLNPITKKEGWWGTAVGPGKAIDTDKYFVICANVIGGCMGSWGPKEVDKKTNEPYGLSFPVITIRDIVRAQETLLDEAKEIAKKIASFSKPAVQMAKESINRSYETSLSEGLRFERRLFHALFSTADQKEGMSAFIEKREANFTNK